jgi:hypothetical protein
MGQVERGQVSIWAPAPVLICLRHFEPRLALMRRFVAGFAILTFVAVLSSYLWWGRLAYYHSAFLISTYAVCLLTVALSHWYFGDSFRGLGLRVSNWREALRAYGLFTLGAAGLIVVVGLLLGRSPGAASGLLTYPAWAGLQQYLLQNFLRLRFETLFSPSQARNNSSISPRSDSSNRRFTLSAILASASAAAVFALLHWPNESLVVLSLAAGFSWCLLFSRVPNLYAACVSQAVLGLLLAMFFKPGILDGFSVGRPGFRYESYGDGVQVAAGYAAGGVPVIATLPGPDREHRSLIRIFDPSGRLLKEWAAFPEFDFSARFAVGDLGFGAGDELVAVPGPAESNPPLVRVFSLNGRLESQFLASNIPEGFGASVSVRCGEIFVGTGPGPDFPARGARYTPAGSPLGTWDFSSDAGFKNGIQLLPLPLNCKEKLPSEMLLWGTAISVNPSDFVVWSSSEVAQRETLPTTYGLSLTVVKLSGKQFIAVAPGPLVGYPPWIRIFRENRPWEMVRDFVAFTDPGAAGANLAAVDLDHDGRDELVVGEGCAPGRPSLIRLLRVDGELLRQWQAYD